MKRQRPVPKHQQYSFHRRPLAGQVACLCLLFLMLTSHPLSLTGEKHLAQTVAAQQSLKPVVTAPKATQPAVTPPAPPGPVSTPTKTPVSKPAVSSTKPAPVVVPAPNSSVSSLTPTSPTVPSSGSSSSSSSSGSSTNSNGSSSSNSQPPTTTSSYTSTNWSGYLATTGSFSTISGSWVAPSATGNGFSTSADAAWIGIGGVTSGDLIQVGTDNTVSAGGQVTTGAFYELLPAVSQPIPSLVVSPGDTMTAQIIELSSGQWSISITDVTTGQTYSTTVAYTSSNSSAEWIEEDPSYASGRLIPFDDFSVVNFTGSAITVNGSLANLTSANAVPITLVSRSGQNEAVPSAISGGNSFSVTRQ